MTDRNLVSLLNVERQARSRFVRVSAAQGDPSVIESAESLWAEAKAAVRAYLAVEESHASAIGEP